MLDIFFPNTSYKIILDRKLNITTIKAYKAENNNKYPPIESSCINKMINSILHKPNPYEYNYDYQLYPNYTYHEFTRDLIRKYDVNFNNYKIHFKMKHLSHRTVNSVINEIDKMYLQFNSYGLRQICKTHSGDSQCSFSRQNSTVSSEDLSSRSILKTSSRVSSRRTSYKPSYCTPTRAAVYRQVPNRKKREASFNPSISENVYFVISPTQKECTFPPVPKISINV